MKIKYLFSGINKEKGFNKKQEEYLKKDIKNNLTITFIATDFSNYDYNDEKYISYLKYFNNIEISFKNSYLIDNRISKEKSHELINNSDIIFLMGGIIHLQVLNIEKYELKDLLKEREGITISVSAGTINQAKNVVYKDDSLEEKIVKYAGIGLTDINIYPHLDFQNLDFLREVFEVSKHQKVIALPNDSFMRIEDDKVEYIGDYYEIENETINYPAHPYTEINHLGTLELETERLLLRRTKLSDIDEFFYMQLNPNLRRYLGPTKLGSNPEKEKKYFNEDKYNELNYYRWTIIKKEDNKILGTIYLNMHDEKARIAGIDYWIREDEWGNGYTTEASKCVLDFAFQQLDLYRIESCGGKDNPGTWRVMEKIGLKYEGTRKQAYFYYYGGVQDLVLYGLTQEEYLEDNK